MDGWMDGWMKMVRPKTNPVRLHVMDPGLSPIPNSTPPPNKNRVGKSRGTKK